MKILGFLLVLYVCQIVGHLMMLMVAPDYFDSKLDFFKTLSPFYVFIKLFQSFKSLE